MGQGRLGRLLIGTGLVVGLVGAQAAVGLITADSAGAAPVHGGGTYQCSGGNVPPGHYESMLISGVCYMPAGNIVIEGNLTIAPGALLDAVTAGDPVGTPVVPATVDVGGNTWVGPGAVLLLGCSPNITCTAPPAISFDHLRGNLTAVGAQGVVVHSASIGGNVSLLGGGGGTAADTCNSQMPSTPLVTNLEPWSEDANLDFTPVYSDFEDVSIGGNQTVDGLTSCWLGSLRNEIGGSASFIGNNMGDPDASEVDNNLIQGNLFCFNDLPAVQFGDTDSAPNLVGGFGAGECGFNVKVLNPASEAMAGPGIYEHVAVPIRSLGNYSGLISQTPEASLPQVETSSGDTIVGQILDFVLKGNGLKGSGVYDPSAPPGESGEQVLATVYPNGSESFTAYLNCLCSFGGQTGAISIRAYGTTSPSGLTTGSFLITSGGGPATGSLSTLAGYGSFTSRHAPSGSLWLTEHLRIT